MSKKVYTTNCIPAPEEPPGETVTIHLRVDETDSSASTSRFSEINGVSAFEEENVFVALPLEISANSSKSLALDPPQYDPDDVYDAQTADPAPDVTKPSSYAKKVVHLLKDFSEKNKIGEWVFSTSTLCHWCCHSFSSVPIGIPVRYDGEHFFVSGCFCGFSCAAAQNQNSGEHNTVIANRHSLLCTMASKTGCNEQIRAAPPRLALSCFGGYLSIEEFRAYSDSDRVMIVNLPPMRSTAQQIEEVSEADVGGGYNFIPLDHVRTERGLNCADLTLKRAKPLLDLKNTLHNSMNVQIISGE